MTTGKLTERLTQKFYDKNSHPYRIFEAEIARWLTPETVILDAGCGRSVEIASIVGRCRVRMALGVDVIRFPVKKPGCHLVQGDVGKLPVRSASSDVVITRSVMEHVQNPLAVYQEFYRVLRSGGVCIILTPNVWDYASIGSRLVPNRFHPWLVKRMEGRDEADTFPAYYRANSLRSIRRLAADTGFQVEANAVLDSTPPTLCSTRFSFYWERSTTNSSAGSIVYASFEAGC